MRLEGRVAVITGGASGMGLATVHRFLDEGASVVAADLNEARGEELLQRVTETGQVGQFRFQSADVARETDVASLFETAMSAFGRLDVVFNNAGVGGAIGPLTKTTESAWDYTFDVLAKGVFFGIKHAAALMRDQKAGGTIINTASVAGLSGDAGPLVYSAAKAAVINLTRSAAVELGPDRIRVNAICPGFIVTPLAVAGRDEERTRETFSRAQPLPFAGCPEHIAGVAAFLASDDAAFVTGETILVDGGLIAAGPQLSVKFPRTSARSASYFGVTKGSTGQAAELQRID